MAYLGSPQSMLVEHWAGYDRYKMSTSDITIPLFASQSRCWKNKLMNVEWFVNATADAAVHNKCIVDNVAWHWLMLLAWSTLGLADPAFHWLTLVSPCECRHVTADASIHSLIFSPIRKSRLTKEHMPWHTLCDNGQCKFFPKNSNIPWVTRVGLYRSCISLKNFSFQIHTFHVRCV